MLLYAVRLTPVTVRDVPPETPWYPVYTLVDTNVVLNPVPVVFTLDSCMSPEVTPTEKSILG